jgi:hypothetical protein
MQSKEQALKKTIGKRYLFIRSYYPLETEIGIVKSVVDGSNVSMSFRGDTLEKVSIFDLRNPEQDI